MKDSIVIEKRERQRTGNNISQFTAFFYKGTKVHPSVGLSILAEILCHKCRNMSTSSETHRTHTSTCRD